MNYVSGLLSSMYGSSLGLGNASVFGTPSASVLARVEQTMAGQRGAAVRLNQSLNSSQARLSGLGQLQGALSVFEDLAESLAGSGLSTRATASAPTVLNVATSAGALAGTFAVEVSQLAQQQILVSGEADSADVALGTGATTIVRLRSGETSKSITIDSRNNSLQGIADALKEAGFDAALVRSGTGTALQLRSASGDDQQFDISVAGDAVLRGLFNGLAETQSAQDAVVTVDGETFRSADNRLEDVLEGATLNLTATGQSTVTIARDNDQLAKNVASFVTGFNALQDRLASLQKGSLRGNTALGQVSSQLNQLLRGAELSAAGLTVDNNGRLKLDKDKLGAAIAADPEALTRLFTNEGRGIADLLNQRIDSLSASRGAVGRAVSLADREVDVLQARRTQLSQALTTQAQALVRLYSQEEQFGGSSSILDLFA